MQQITLKLNNKEISDNFNDFIESSSNRLAYKYINDWESNFGILPYLKVLIIKGSKSSGKSFLAKLWAKKTAGLFLKKNHELTSSILENHQAFIIDGFDSSWHEKDVLHYFNILHEHSKYLLITLNEMPKINLADLASRINSVNKIDILMIDDELMRILIFKQFSNLSILINDDVINYLIKILPREFSKILSIISNINKNSLENKKKITIPFIKSLIDRSLLQL
jgi:chromosomal replication initiation ATPase DnaA